MVEVNKASNRKLKWLIKQEAVVSKFCLICIKLNNTIFDILLSELVPNSMHGTHSKKVGTKDRRTFITTSPLISVYFRWIRGIFAVQSTFFSICRCNDKLCFLSMVCQSIPELLLDYVVSEGHTQCTSAFNLQCKGWLISITEECC